MIYKDIVNEQINIKQHLDEFNEIISGFKSILSDYHKSINIVWKSTPENGNYNTSSLQQVINSKNSFNSFFVSFNFDFMDYMFKLNKLNSISENNETSLNFNRFSLIFKDFLTTLQLYLHNKKPSHIIPDLVLNLSKVVSSYESIINEIEIISKYDTLLENQSSSYGEILELQFYNKIKTPEIIYILEAIPDLYSRGLHLLGIEESEYPLEIIKLESGSWLSKLAGHATVVGLMTNVFQTAIDDLYASYSPLPVAKQRREMSNFEYLEKKLNIRKQLNEEGYDTSRMDEELNQYLAKTYKIGKEVATKSNKIRINKEIKEVDDIYKIKLLEEKNSKLSLSYNSKTMSEEFGLNEVEPQKEELLYK